MYFVLIFCVILGGIFIKNIVIKIYTNYLYQQYISCQHTSHFLNEDYLKMKNYEVDRQLFADLELEEILETIDYTRTTIGGEYLLGSLCHGHHQQELQERYLKILDKKDIQQILYLFHQLEKQHVGLSNFKNNLNALDFRHIMIAVILTGLLILSIAVSFINMNYFKYVIFIMIINIIYSTKYLLQYCKELNEQIRFIRKMVTVLNQIMKSSLKDEMSEKTIQALEIINHSLKVEKVIAFLEKYDIFEILTIFDTVFFIRYFQAYCLKKNVKSFNENLIVCYEEIGFIDQTLSVKVLREHFKTCIPQKTNEKNIIIENGYHPLLNQPVKNSVTVKNNIIITGSNASGKSTFLKMIGVNFILMNAIHTCFASSFTSYPYQLLTAIHIKDDILSGNSYYLAEIKRFEMICQSCKKNECLILIDEILKGTNETERMVIVTGLLSYLFKSHSLIIVTTHDNAIAQKFQVDHYCFHDIKTDSGFMFDYQIKAGICQTGNAIAIMKQMQFDDEIMQLLKKHT